MNLSESILKTEFIFVPEYHELPKYIFGTLFLYKPSNKNLIMYVIFFT
jgi:hypothetical protein